MMFGIHKLTKAADDLALLDLANSLDSDIDGGLHKWLSQCNERTVFYGFGAWEMPIGVRREGWTGADGWQSQTVILTEVENDRGIEIVESALFVAEGGLASYGVRLKGRPTGTVTVLTSNTSGDADLQVTGGGSLVFDETNWYEYQQVTISAVDEPDRLNGQATISSTSAASKP